MNPNPAATSYARLTPWQARTVMLALVLLASLGFAIAPTSPTLSDALAEKSKNGDIHLYMTEVARIHAGENYYAVAAEELVVQGYPTRSVFNWRTPLPMWLVGKMPSVLAGRLILCGAALVLLLMAFEVTSRESPNVYCRAVPLTLLLIGSLLPCFCGETFVLPVLWAGVFMAVSICAYGVNRPYLGAAAGLAALFFRELALPYCVLGAILALRQRRRGELLVWLVGLAAWAIFFALHCWQVKQLITSDATAHHGGWIQLGGMRFVLAIAQMNAYLVLLPMGLTVLYFVAAMFGLAGWQTPLGTRFGLTVCLFVVAFSIVGYDFNRYWGLLISPLLCFGVVRAPVSLVELWRAASLPLPSTFHGRTQARSASEGQA